MTGPNRLPVLAAEIKSSLASVARHHQASVESAIEAGERLREAKALVGHGQWLPWLQEHCELSGRTARDYMRLAEHREQIGSAASIRAALAAVAEEADPLQDTGRWAEPVSRAGTLQKGSFCDWFFVAPSIEHPGHYWLSHMRVPPNDSDLYMSELRRPVAARGVDVFLRHVLQGEGYDAVEWREWPHEVIAPLCCPPDKEAGADWRLAQVDSSLSSA